MIKVKTFVPNSLNSLHHLKLDDEINTFIDENNIKVIDIKYSSSFSLENGKYSFLHTAMLIYDTMDELSNNNSHGTL